MKALAVEAAALCYVVAPDLAGWPLYVLLAADLPSDLRWPDRLEGLTTRHLDLILRPTLERLGRWRGRGPAMVLSPQAIAADLAELGRPARRRCFARTFLGDALHELAHILDAGIGGPEPPAGGRGPDRTGRSRGQACHARSAGSRASNAHAGPVIGGLDIANAG